MDKIIEIDCFDIYETQDGTKWIDFRYMIYDSEDCEYDGDDYDNEAKWYRDVFIKGNMTVKEFLKKVRELGKCYCDIVANFHQNGRDITKPKAEELYKEYVNDREYLYYLHITEDTPCGEYYF